MNPADGFIVNGRRYRRPDRPVVVVCVDGSDPEYHERAAAAGRTPYLDSVARTGTSWIAECAMPSFTNPNNVSIATGVPPSVHGICGNHVLDPETGEEVPMNDPRHLRVPTIFAVAERAGLDVGVVTAKDKLRRLLGAGLSRGPCVSAEYAGQATDEEHRITGVLELAGLPQPDVYSAELSELVLAVGCALLERDRPDLLYLSLSDYVQHTHPPGSPTADDFYAMVDRWCARIDELGAALVVTADHGMNAKSGKDGPNVVYLQALLDERLGSGRSRVVLPITDPYTVHHGSLGSFATIHVPDMLDRDAAARSVSALPGVQEVSTRADAAARYELPADRIGDLVVIADRHVTLGTDPGRHDLSGLRAALRSHGGLTEQRVPFLVNSAVESLPGSQRLRNFDAFQVGTAVATC